jgi:type IV fimbrial biogenesis protein FimT
VDNIVKRIVIAHPDRGVMSPKARRTDGLSQRGFTLVEMLIALVIGALLVSLATPDWRSRNAAAELRNRAHALAQALAVARSEAVKRGTRVDLCPTGDRSRCTAGGAWESGWLSLVGNGGTDSSPPVVLGREGPAREGVTIRANRPLADYVSFTSLGHARRHDGALQMGTFTVCRSGQRALKVVLANSGRARVDTTQEPCP